MNRNLIDDNRRLFLRNFSTFLIASNLGFTKYLTSHFGNFNENSPIKVIDKELVFVGDPLKQSKRSIPSEFIFSQFPKIPEVPDTIQVKYPWKEETCATFPERSLNGFGALNEGIYSEENNILQIISTTPGTPDTKGGSPSYKCWYRLSNDSGETFSDFKLIVLEGNTEVEPIDGVRIGRNGYTIPYTSPFVKSSQGEIMAPVHLHPWDFEKREIYNPANAFLFGDSGVLIGKWTEDKKDIKWDFGDWVRIDHRLSTRGLFEPTIAELTPFGKFAMLMRGSNYRRPELPGYTWLSFSNDYCRTWSKPIPFTYSDGEKFYCPASCSTLFRSEKTGVLYWIGNLLKENSYGNNPRNPLVIGKVDEQNFGLIKDSVVEIDNHHLEWETKNVELSNYKIMEHASLDEIVVALTRREDGNWANHPSWYRIKLS